MAIGGGGGAGGSKWSKNAGISNNTHLEQGRGAERVAREGVWEWVLRAFLAEIK